MNTIYLDWTPFKAIVDSKKIAIQEYSTERWGYVLKAFDELIEYVCRLDVEDNAGADVTDYETNYQSAANLAVIQRDSAGVVLTKGRIVPADWHYQIRGLLVTLGNFDCVTAKTFNYGEFSYITVGHFDAQNVPIVSQAQMSTAVKTYIDYEPPYDYAMIGGALHQDIEPIPDLYIGAVLAPDIPLNAGGSVEFAGGINLKHIGRTSDVRMDGRAPKVAPYDPVNHTGKLRLTLHYPATSAHQFHLLLELFKPPGV